MPDRRPRRWTRYGPLASVIPEDYPRPGIPAQPHGSLDGMWGPGRDSHHKQTVEGSPIPDTAGQLLDAIDRKGA